MKSAKLIKKRKWTYIEAWRHINDVEDKKAKYGLTYCSACDFVGKAPVYAATYPPVK